MRQPTRGVDSGFSDPGADTVPLAGYLDAAAVLESVAEFKRVSLDALGLRPGDEALDVGSGTGDEVRAMAARVGPGGRAVGVDVNDGMVAEARGRTPEGIAATYLRADALDLPFEDATFDAVRTERTLQHVTRPGAVVAELARVVRPGGVVAAAEPDYDTFVVDAPSLDMARRVQRGLGDHVRQPAIGRSLPRRLAAAGLVVELVCPITLVLTDAAMADGLWFLRAAAEARDDDEALAWLDRSRAGEGEPFLAAMTGFVVAARRPGA